MLADLLRSLRRQAPWILAVTVVGAVAFVLAQVNVRATVITEFLGDRITKRGGYDPALAPLIGWAVHLAVSLSYALLFAVIAELLPKRGAPRWGATAALAVLLGWVTTLVTVPAIAVTVSVLAGQGIPATLPPLNTDTGFTLRNHLYFFAICWLGLVLARDLLAGLRPARAAAR